MNYVGELMNILCNLIPNEWTVYSVYSHFPGNVPKYIHTHV